MDKDEAIGVLIRIANIYISMIQDDLQEEEQEEYTELLQALEVLREYK